MTPYELEKWVWTDADFEQMGWHDCRIRAFALLPDDGQCVLDIDYILEWVQSADTIYFQFWVAPATLVFEHVYDVVLDIQTDDELEIINLLREVPPPPGNPNYIYRDQQWKWTFDCQEGSISLQATGDTQYIRSAPRLVQRQYLVMNERGGLSFARSRVDM